MDPTGSFLTLEIADTRISLETDRPLNSVAWRPGMLEFESAAKPHATIRCTFSDLPDDAPDLGEPLFDSDALWRLHRVDGGVVLTVSPPGKLGESYRVAVFDEDFSRGELVCDPGRHTGWNDGLLPDPFEYPIDQVVVLSLLAGRRRGFLLHSCGIADDDRGFLFAGSSGAGKTTMARLWADEATVLCDDRIAVCSDDGGVSIHGTPWHGDLPSVSPRRAPLRKVFFLSHAEQNHHRVLTQAEAAARLMGLSILPIWSRRGTSAVLEVASSVAALVPCHELGFRPSQEVLEYVRCAD